MNNIELYADSNRGIYIPQHFIESCTEGWSGISDENRAILAAGPEHEHYWDAWESVLDSARFKLADGRVFSLHQDGDLWAIALDNLTDAERLEFFGE
jgi:hypothetical protein